MAVGSASLSEDARRVLRSLRLNRCVLIKGVPASGKTRLLGEVSRIFTTQGTGRVGTSTRALVPAGGAGGASAYLPSPDRTDRIALSLVMNQNTRYRDVWRAPEPKVDGSAGFQLSKGALYRANEHAKTQAGTALVAIDELNRGPAVNVFGPSIVAIEADKRSDDDNQVIDGQTRTFELPTDTGGYEDYWLSAHLYILCAQNNADTSVEAIDTAFLRRFTPIELLPNEQVLIQHFGLDSLDGELPETATDAKDLYRAAVRAWRNVNRKLSVGASPDFQIGHGALMNPNESVPDSNMDEALDYVRRGWARIDQHVAEVFYGKPDQIASALWVDEVEGHPYRIVTVAFADLDQVVLDRTDSDLYLLLRAIASAP